MTGASRLEHVYQQERDPEAAERDDLAAARIELQDVKGFAAANGRAVFAGFYRVSAISGGLTPDVAGLSGIGFSSAFCRADRRGLG